MSIKNYIATIYGYIAIQVCTCFVAKYIAHLNETYHFSSKLEAFNVLEGFPPHVSNIKSKCS